MFRTWSAGRLPVDPADLAGRPTAGRPAGRPTSWVAGWPGRTTGRPADRLKTGRPWAAQNGPKGPKSGRPGRVGRPDREVGRPVGRRSAGRSTGPGRPVGRPARRSTGSKPVDPGRPQTVSRSSRPANVWPAGRRKPAGLHRSTGKTGFPFCGILVMDCMPKIAHQPSHLTNQS